MTSEDKAKALSNPIRDEGERSLLGEVKAAQQKLAVGTLKEDSAPTKLGP